MLIGVAIENESQDEGESAAAISDLNVTVISDFESILEVNNLAKIRPHFSMIPDFQYIWNPGRHVENPNTPGEAENNAAVVGVRADISY